jgi:hypothetical protein
MILSYIFGHNFIFRIALYLLIGVSAGYSVAIVITKVIIPYLVIPFYSGDWTQRILIIIPIILSFLVLILLILKLKNLGSIPMAIVIGMFAGVLIVGLLLGTLVPQIIGTVDMFSTSIENVRETSDWISLLDAVVMLVGIIASLMFFHHGSDKDAVNAKESSSSNKPFSKLGQIFIGITLGVLFAGVYAMALMALISRIEVIKNFIQQIIQIR